jgi:hypothetical protein
MITNNQHLPAPNHRAALPDNAKEIGLTERVATLAPVDDHGLPSHHHVLRHRQHTPGEQGA